MSNRPITRPRSDCRLVRGVYVHPDIVGRLTGLLGHVPWVRLSSGWRSVDHNGDVGGARRSRHLCGAAVDITGKGHDLLVLLEAAPRHGAVEAIYEGDHLHVAWERPL